MRKLVFLIFLTKMKDEYLRISGIATKYAKVSSLLGNVENYLAIHATNT